MRFSTHARTRKLASLQRRLNGSGVGVEGGWLVSEKRSFENGSGVQSNAFVVVQIKAHLDAPMRVEVRNGCGTRVMHPIILHARARARALIGSEE